VFVDFYTAFLHICQKPRKTEIQRRKCHRHRFTSGSVWRLVFS